MTTNNAVNNGLSGETGSGSFVGSDSPSVTSPRIINGLYDANGNLMVSFAPVVSSVNYIQLANASASSAIGWEAMGADTNIIWTLSGKGTGGVQIQGNRAGANASAGYVGEIIQSVIASGSAVSLTTGTSADITFIDVTAGDWRIDSNVFVSGSTSNLNGVSGWASLTSATLPDISLISQIFPSTPFVGWGSPCPFLRVNVTTTTRVYLSVRATFGSGTATACGGIYATRRR